MSTELFREKQSKDMYCFRVFFLTHPKDGANIHKAYHFISLERKHLGFKNHQNNLLLMEEKQIDEGTIWACSQRLLKPSTQMNRTCKSHQS